MSDDTLIKTKKGQRSKKKIFDAALDLIRTKGFEQTTLVDICKAAEIGNGTFYHYFNSKQDIIISYVKQESIDLIHYYDSLNITTYSDAILKVVNYQVSYILLKGHEFVSNFYSILLLSKNQFYNLDDFAIKKIFLDCFEKGQKNNEFKSEFSPEYMSELAFSLLYASSTHWCYTEGNIDLHNEVRDKFLTLIQIFKA